jgi:hypothetical protein
MSRHATEASATPPAGRQKKGREKRERKQKGKICKKEINYFLFLKLY